MRGSERLAGVDAFRWLLCFAVALLHSLPAQREHFATSWAVMAAICCRGAVPFFFVASGYFLRVPERLTGAVLWRPLRRLLPVYVAWAAIYLAVDAFATGKLTGLSPRALLTGGSGFHLWFLPVLGLALAAIPISLALLGVRLTAAWTIGLSIAGVLLGAYHEAAGLPALGAVRMTMAPSLVLLGWWLADRKVTVSVSAALIAVVAALGGIVLEEALIARLAGTSITSHDLVVSTYLFGAATFLLALALGGSQRVTWLAPLGRISLGVYAAHLLFVRLLEGWIDRGALAGVLAIAAGATILATLLALALSRVPVLRRLVS